MRSFLSLHSYVLPWVALVNVSNSRHSSYSRLELFPPRSVSCPTHACASHLESTLLLRHFHYEPLPMLPAQHPPHIRHHYQPREGLAAFEDRRKPIKQFAHSVTQSQCARHLRWSTPRHADLKKADTSSTIILSWVCQPSIRSDVYFSRLLHEAWKDLLDVYFWFSLWEELLAPEYQNR